GGAEVIVLCTNTMHLSSMAINRAVPIPFIHIADATGEKIIEHKIKRVGLLGTKFTMTKDFYKNILQDRYEIETIIPDPHDQESVHHIIYNELVKGEIRDESRNIYIDIIRRLQDRGARGVILGCTEIPLLISSKDVDIPVFDTTRIHAEKAIEWAIS
ncbi:MAG: amino acid racemase, partial [Bacteroidia bacterium]|nr:amino acid racemase [Bacteroidia bacterium]